MTARADALRQMIAASPDDPFPRYGLAMELKSSRALDEAHAAFEDLERRFPDYVPQYLMHFQVLVALEEKDVARALAERGRAVMRKAGNAHALSELESALAALDDV